MVSKLFGALSGALIFLLALGVGSSVAPPRAYAAVTAPNSWGLIAAGERSVVLGTDTGRNETVLNNGTYFYNNPSASMGFASVSSISQGSADVLDSSLGDGTCSVADGGAYRLSWHRSNGNIAGGWRYGCVTFLNSDNAAVRAVFQSDSPSYYPSGPQLNVSHSSLLNSGWEQCYIGGYGTSVAFSTVTTNCTKTYIALAGGVGASVPVLSAPTISGDSSTTSSVSLTFASVANASSYTAYLYGASSGGAPVKTVTNYTSGASITGLSEGTDYYAALVSVGDNINYATSAESTPRYLVSTTSLATQTITWGQPTSLTLANSGDAPTTATTTGDGAITYSVTNAGTTGCAINSSTAALTFSSTGTCAVLATAASTATYSSATKALSITISRGTFSISAPSSKVGTSASSFTDVCASSCDVTGFAPADSIRVVVSKSDGSSLSGLVKLGSTTGLTQSLSGYQADATAASGFAEIAFEGTQSQVNAALETLAYKSPLDESDETLGISATLAGAAYFSGTGHYYEVVSGDNKTHAQAITAAAARTFNGLNGYLATILTEEENRFIDGKISDRSVWIGGKYNGTEWEWITGPVSDQISFWSGTSPGTAISGVYAEWEPGQPDGSDVCLSTNYDGGDADNLGNWDDLTCTASKKWVVEYGGNGGTVLKQASASFAVGLPAAPSPSTPRNNDDDAEPVVSPVATPTVPRPTVRLPFPSPTPPRPTVLSAPVKTPASVSTPSDRLVSRVGGVPAPVTTSTNGDDELSVSTSSLKLSLKMSQQSSVLETVDASAELTIRPGAKAAVTATGLLPNTTLQVWLPNVSERELGRLSVNAAGEIQGELGLSSSLGEDPLPVGRQTLQMTGYDAAGNQTVVEMPVNIAQGPPTPEPNREAGALPELRTGESLATSAGVPTSTTVTVLSEQNAVSVTGDGWGINLNIPAVSGTVEDENGQPVVRLVQSSVASMSGSGMQPGTIASVWFFSEPTLMGTVSVAEDGTFTLNVMVDAQFISAGNHTVQVQGVGTDGYIKSVNMGVLVEEPAAQTTASSAMVMLWWALATAVAIALFVVILVSRRRRQA